MIKATKLVPSWNVQLVEVYEREMNKGNYNRATLSVARKPDSYMLALDRHRTGFCQITGAKMTFCIIKT